MDDQEYQDRIKALAERSSYVENVLRHALVASLSSVVWAHNPWSALQVFNAEVDDSGFDLVFSVGSELRYVQLKQAHDSKSPTHCSIRLSFSNLAGSCVVLMSYSAADLRLSRFRFFGGAPSESMAAIDGFRATKAPGRRKKSGERKIRQHYRDIPVSQFQGPMSIEELVKVLFPSATTSSFNPAAARRAAREKTVPPAAL